MDEEATPEHVEKTRAQNEMVSTAVAKELRLEALKATVQLLEKETLDTPINLKSVPLDVTWLYNENPVIQTRWMLDMSTRIDEIDQWLAVLYTADQDILKYETTQKELENRRAATLAEGWRASVAAIEESQKHLVTEPWALKATCEAVKSAHKVEEENRACEAAKQTRADFEAFEAARGVRVERDPLKATREMREIQDVPCACESQHASEGHHAPEAAITAPGRRDRGEAHGRVKRPPGCAFKVLFLVVAALLSSLLFVFTINRLEPPPDYQLESTFQPNHNIANMINETRPDLGDLRRLMFYASHQGHTVDAIMGSKRLPNKKAIAKDMGDAAEAMQRMGLQIENFRSATWRMVAIGLEIPYSQILRDLKYKSTLSWYNIETLATPSYANLRQEWLFSATKSRGKITELAAFADRLISDLSDIAYALGGIEQRMIQSQQGHIEENAKLKSKWLYRLKIFRDPILKDTCEELIAFVESYLGAVNEVEKGLATRRDVLAAAAKSLDLPKTTTWEDKYIFDKLYRFEEYYQRQAHEMVQHLKQAADGLS